MKKNICPTPGAQFLQNKLGADLGEHIDIRTAELADVGINQWVEAFEKRGYQIKNEYVFSAEKVMTVELRQRFDQGGTSLPIYISSILPSYFSESAQVELASLRKTLLNSKSSLSCVTQKETSFDITTYRTLLEESAFLASVYRCGFGQQDFNEGSAEPRVSHTVEMADAA